jgi:NAD(P)-dependent dehydrogenase (short-subunit alcohol dehydrogenase family)
VRDTVAQIEAEGGMGLALHADISQSVQVRAAAEALAQWRSPLDILLCNAGVMSNSTLEATSEEEWDRLHGINLRGAFLTIKYAGPQVRRPGGVIITMGSIDGLYGAPENAAYAATKGGVIAMTRAAALDYAPLGVRVNCICPGWIDTPINDAFFKDKPEEKARAVAMQPVGRLGTPDDIARAAVFLASDDSSFILGLPMIVDGGITVN